MDRLVICVKVRTPAAMINIEFIKLIVLVTKTQVSPLSPLMLRDKESGKLSHEEKKAHSQKARSKMQETKCAPCKHMKE